MAEDNEINALLASSLLTKLGHRRRGRDGAAALKAWTKLAPQAGPTIWC